MWSKAFTYFFSYLWIFQNDHTAYSKEKDRNFGLILVAMCLMVFFVRTLLQSLDFLAKVNLKIRMIRFRVLIVLTDYDTEYAIRGFDRKLPYAICSLGSKAYTRACMFVQIVQKTKNKHCV